MAVAKDLYFLVMRTIPEPDEGKAIIVAAGGERRRTITARTMEEGELEGKRVEGKVVRGGGGVEDRREGEMVGVGLEIGWRVQWVLL